MYDKFKAKALYLKGEYDAAAAMFLEGAKEGDELASFNYGYCLLMGIGVPYDPREAKSYFMFARDMQGGESCYNLAMMYMHGEGVAKDYHKSFKYMKISAMRGCIEAQLYLGMVYTTGYLLEPDIVRIRMLPFHTPEFRDEIFMLEGDADEAALDEEKRFSVTHADARAAHDWFQRASRHDPTYVGSLVAKGKFLYAKCYIDGLGVDFDRKKGEMLMIAAGKSGSMEAVEFLAESGLIPKHLLGEARSEKDATYGGV